MSDAVTPVHRRGTSALAWGLTLLAVGGAAGTLALAIANRASLPDVDAADPISIILPPGLAIVGGLVASRRPRNPTGWLFLVASLVVAITGVEDQYARFALVTVAGRAPGAVWALWVSGWSLSLVYPAGVVALLLLLLPDGRLPSRRWRPLAFAEIFTSALVMISVALAPGPVMGSSSGINFPVPDNPVGMSALQGLIGGGQTPVDNVLWLLTIAMLLCAATAPVVRMRRARGDERQQLKWIAYAVVITAAINAGWAVVGSFNPSLPSWIFDINLLLGFGIAFPLAAAVAIFKHRLYDIDVVISRTLVYGSLAVFITAVYVGIAVGIGTLVGGGGKPNLGLSILATAVVAIGFQPVRERVQRVANRLVYGKRATPYEVLSQFSERVAESYSVDEVMPRMARVLAEGTGAQRADVWVRSGDSWHAAAVWPVDVAPAGVMHEGAAPSQLDGKPQPPDTNLQMLTGNLPPAGDVSRLVEVRHQGDLLGALSVTKRPGEPLTPVEENLLTDLAGQAGLVMRNVGLTSDLQARIIELRASRQRLVTAQDEERRRLERNLHDGAQQHLVALKVKLGLADMLMGRDPEKAKATLAQLKGDADEALETLRDLARGIYPPLLADKGLVVALESQARKATVPVTVEAEHVERYPQDLEAAVYFCCLEALQNVQKYAKATQVVIRLRGDEQSLHFEVADDGAGFDTATVKKGSGLTNMVDRLDALGGVVDITTAPGQGSTLRGSLPVPAASGAIAPLVAATAAAPA